MRLKNKIALVTGAASGMGESAALIFAREGAKVVVATAFLRFETPDPEIRARERPACPP